MSLPLQIHELTSLASASVGAMVAVSNAGLTRMMSLTDFSPSLPFIQSGTGAITRSVQAKERDIVSVKDFGAVGDGSTNDAAAIQSAADALGSRGGTILFPCSNNEIYQCASGLNFDDSVGIHLKGDGVGTTGGGGALLRFSGTGTCISARSVTGFKMSNLSVYATNAANTGHLLDFGYSAAAIVSQLWRVEDCAFIGAGAASTMLSCVNVERAIHGTLKNNLFATCPIGILGRSTTAAFWCNGIEVTGNQFYQMGTMAIRNPGQAWVIQGNVFEQLSSGNAGAIDTQIAVPFTQAGIQISGNWFGDANASGTWIFLAGGGISITGNYISTGATGIVIRPSAGVVITGNAFDTMTTAVDFPAATVSSLAYFGNSYTSVTNEATNFANVASGTPLRGTATNDSAAAGIIGERVSSAVGSTNFPATGTYGDLTSISLTAGDWDVDAVMVGSLNTATMTGHTFLGISTTTGNSAAGLTAGDTLANGDAPTATANSTVTLPSVRMSLTATTTVYMKFQALYSAGVPQALGRITARRVR